ncbi:uncharacterized protein JCM15063_002535 [Sporobolomyces koalae]|uniref:uncharacterized protein n=1 Tax=Sporobolomyces koalae TaxID=500713 RepID=UPI0031720A60
MSAQPGTDGSETTPLLPKAAPEPRPGGIFSPLNRLFLVTLLLSTSFMCTSTTLIYAFRMILCDEYWGRGLGHGGSETIDRCAIRDIDAWSAREVSYMVTLTTISGTLNLFSTGYLTRTFGVRFSMFFQTFWPSIRVLCQLWGIVNGTITGVRVMQFTQLLTILGGGAGYILCANTFAAALVKPENRTATFGRLQGLQMVGTGVGLCLGGWIGDRYGLEAPFLLAFVLLALSTVISGLFLPYIPPTTAEEAAKTTGGGFWTPLRIFAPRKVNKGDKVVRWYGLFLIGVGSFVSTFATSTIQILLQLISTAAFGFTPSSNGTLMAVAALSRGAFLTFLFPVVINRGREWYSSANTASPPAIGQLPDSFAEIEPIQPLLQTDPVQEPPPPPPPTDQEHGSAFDLAFLRGSILVDAVLTGCIGFSRAGWHLYIAALVIPLASGTAPASKGVVMEMVSKAEQADALQGIALIETLAMTLTVSVFGVIFAHLSEAGRPFDVFFINAAMAVVAGVILQFARFAPKPRVAVA